jgi:hypothetical protein
LSAAFNIQQTTLISQMDKGKKIAVEEKKLLFKEIKLLMKKKD